MIQWITGGRYRLHAILLAYFAIHVVVRSLVSNSLSFDESEQVFLGQWVHLGYNSQPPLYTWMQVGLFELFGHSIVPVALLKNVILLLTYLAVFAFVRRATGNDMIAVAASIGMLTVPQIAWESHRDLSHTVLVTLATAWLFYCVVRIKDAPSRFWYATLGVVCGVGMLSKYNFAISIVAIGAAAWTLPRYRRCLLDARMLIAIAIAGLMVAPHAVWAWQNVGLATGKTVGQLTTTEPISWAECVTRGGADLIASYAVCCAASVLVFAVCFRETIDKTIVRLWIPSLESESADGGRELTLLIERFLWIVFAMLVLLVASGYAIKIKNHWLHPIIFLAPAFFVLKLRELVQLSSVQIERLTKASLAFGVLVIAMTAAKPMTASYRGEYSWLNMPYETLVAELPGSGVNAPVVIFADDMRTAGNLKLQSPEALVLSLDNPQLSFSMSDVREKELAVVIGHDSDAARGAMQEFVHRQLGVRSSSLRWQGFDVPYYYAGNRDYGVNPNGQAGQGDQHDFAVGVVANPVIAEQRWETDSSKR